MEYEIITSDIYFAAAIMALDGRYVSVDATDRRHMRFTMAYSLDVLDEWEVAWVNGTLIVNAQKYKDAIQRIKGIIYSH